ncbi:MAG: hypothetical protein KF768_05220 [Phycisphaeraceae bacterium]|nr:hypothetical protein [Phycisphaeraceae bacterium]
MAHPRRQTLAALLLLAVILWGLAVWVWLEPAADGWVVWHRVGTVVAGAVLTIYLFLEGTRPSGPSGGSEASSSR